MNIGSTLRAASLVALTAALIVPATTQAFAADRWQHHGGWAGGHERHDWGRGGGGGAGLGGALLGLGVGVAVGAAIAAPRAYYPPPPVYYAPAPTYYAAPPAVYYGY
ncbi:MAG TPA: hypothetical protein VNE18_12470 [Rhodanobacter sp.]|nr:hypothetical protein [Rhodanobacter sp.]